MRFKKTVNKCIPQGIYNKVDQLRTVLYWLGFKRERTANVKKLVEVFQKDEKYTEEIKYLKKYGADYFPYPWAKKHYIWKIKSGGKYSMAGNERYMLHKGKKLYMKMIPYSQLLMEQNEHSPHCYFSRNFRFEVGDCFVDVGAAEGMISLDVVEKASKIFLIECNDFWIESLKRTFAPYKEKIQIIRKFVSDVDDEENIRLDTLLSHVDAPIVLKIDVEGMERKVLAGANKTLNKETTKVALCTYHRKQDAEVFTDMLKNMGYKFEQSEGYMAMVNDSDNPEFRKAMIRAWKEPRVND